MEASNHFAISVSEDIGCQSCIYNHSSEKSYVEQKKCTCRSMQKTVKVEPKDHDISSTCEEGNMHGVVVIAAGGDLNVQDHQGNLSSSDSPSDPDDTFSFSENDMCQEFSKSLYLETKMQKSLSKCATFPSSKGAGSNSSAFKGGEETTSSAVRGQCHTAYSRSVSLPASLNLVSAMKGGRAQNGTLPNIDLRVKWAPEVYDPPSTTISHTVRSHQRPKSKKKDKHKHKGKSSRGNGGDRKHTNRKNVSNMPPLDARLQTSGDRLLFDEYGKSMVETLDYGASSQEAKCGCSFLREALPKVHLSVGEAS